MATCCAVSGNDCSNTCRDVSSYDETNCCLDHASETDWLFGLGPATPAKFGTLKTGNSDSVGYQNVLANNWPWWGADHPT